MKCFFLTLVLLLSGMQLQCYSRQQRPVAMQEGTKAFTFVPEMVYPLGMRPRQVTSGFLLRVSPDSLVCYLPYFGQATGIDYGSGRGSTDFSTTKFDHTTSKGKKGATIITLRPLDHKAVRTISITYYTGSDYAHVAITFNRQQSISYRGRITGAVSKE